jgi:uncharacterized membrane protein
MPELTETCPICGKTWPKAQMVPVGILRPAIAQEIVRAHPTLSPEDSICLEDLGSFRGEYVESILEAEKGELSSLEEEVLQSLKENEILSTDVEKEFVTALTFGERLSDRIADFGGSWAFIIIFFAILAVWIAINTVALLLKPFDPYPYIFLNLVLSCLAAMQAPVIMMSQNRQEDRDRLRSQHDYQVNLKAELEIRHLHQKVDHLLKQQWERLIEIQNVQLELMEEIRSKTKGTG